jgi:hypothetical protein
LGKNRPFGLREQKGKEAFRNAIRRSHGGRTSKIHMLTYDQRLACQFRLRLFKSLAVGQYHHGLSDGSGSILIHGFLVLQAHDCPALETPSHRVTLVISDIGGT